MNKSAKKDILQSPRTTLYLITSTRNAIPFVVCLCDSFKNDLCVNSFFFLYFVFSFSLHSFPQLLYVSLSFADKTEKKKHTTSSTLAAATSAVAATSTSSVERQNGEEDQRGELNIIILWKKNV